MKSSLKKISIAPCLRTKTIVKRLSCTSLLILKNEHKPIFIHTTQSNEKLSVLESSLSKTNPRVKQCLPLLLSFISQEKC